MSPTTISLPAGVVTAEVVARIGAGDVMRVYLGASVVLVLDPDTADQLADAVIGALADSADGQPVMTS